jgi:hypothetical protein
MPCYKVVWVIDVDAENPREAAREALAIQRDPNSIATHFVVVNPADPHLEHHVDLTFPNMDKTLFEGKPI